MRPYDPNKVIDRSWREKKDQVFLPNEPAHTPFRKRLRIDGEGTPAVKDKKGRPLDDNNSIESPFQLGTKDKDNKDINKDVRMMSRKEIILYPVIIGFLFFIVFLVTLRLQQLDQYSYKDMEMPVNDTDGEFQKVVWDRINRFEYSVEKKYTDINGKFDSSEKEHKHKLDALIDELKGNQKKETNTLKNELTKKVEEVDKKNENNWR
jgi:hypothetical protein